MGGLKVSRASPPTAVVRQKSKAGGHSTYCSKRARRSVLDAARIPAGNRDARGIQPDVRHPYIYAPSTRRVGIRGAVRPSTLRPGPSCEAGHTRTRAGLVVKRHSSIGTISERLL